MSFEMHYKIQIVFRYCNSTHTRRDEIGKEIEFNIPGKKLILIFMQLVLNETSTNKSSLILTDL
jgi:hypothetical protein